MSWVISYYPTLHLYEYVAHKSDVMQGPMLLGRRNFESNQSQFIYDLTQSHVTAMSHRPSYRLSIMYHYWLAGEEWFAYFYFVCVCVCVCVYSGSLISGCIFSRGVHLPFIGSYTILGRYTFIWNDSIQCSNDPVRFDVRLYNLIS